MTSPKRATPGMPLRRSVPTRPRRRVSEQVGTALALLIVGAVVGVGAVSLIQGAAPSAATIPSTAPSDPAEATDAIVSDVPEDSVQPGSPVLEALLPTSIAGTTLTVESAVDATSLSSGPDARALNAAVVHAGKLASDLQIAIAYDDSGSIDLTILGFRVDGLSAAGMRDAVLSAWLAAGTPGVTTTNLNWSGTDVTRISYGDDGADEYLITVHDSVFVLETADAAVAQSAAAALAAPATVTPSAGASPGS